MANAYFQLPFNISKNKHGARQYYNYPNLLIDNPKVASE